MSEVDDWAPVQPADDWQPVKAEAAPASGMFDAVKGYVQPVVNAFGQGFEEGFGPDRLGLSDESRDLLQRSGFFKPDDKSYTDTGWRAPFYAMNDLVGKALVGAGATGEAAFRGTSGVFRGLQAAGIEAGLHRDIVSIPEAFFGSPHPMGIPKGPRRVGVQPESIPEPLRETAGVHIPEAALSKEGVEVPQSGIIAYHGSPHDFGAFSMDRIGTGEGAQAYGHGLYFAENPMVAREYQKMGGLPEYKTVDRFEPFNPGSPKPITAARASDGALLGTISKEGDGFRVISDGPDDIRLNEVVATEREAQERIREFVKQNPTGQMYRVRINANKEHFLDWDKPLSEQSEPILQKLAGIAGTTVEKLKASSLKTGDWLDAMGGGAHGFAFSKSADMSAALRDAGIPGIKYLDQGSRVIDPPESVLSKILDNRHEMDRLKRAYEKSPTKEIGDRYEQLRAETDALHQQVEEHAKKQQTSNFVLFDDKLVEITDKNGHPVNPPKPPKMKFVSTDEARDLGVIGEERPPITEGTPAEAASRLMKTDEPKWECW